MIMSMLKMWQGDCLERMKELEDNSIDLTLTSPPYDNLRTYKGNNKEWNEDVWKDIIVELYRIIKEGGVVVWIVGDETKNFCESLSSFKQAIHFVEKAKFNLLDTMIYEKIGIPPAYPTMKRYAQVFEYMFVFSKERPKTFNPIKEEKKHKSSKKSTFRQKNGTLKPQNKVSDSIYKNKNNLWRYSSGGKNTGHPAPFPEQLAKDHIYSWSNEGDIVFDPMAGSGTTGVACAKLNRKFIGIEKDPEYYEIARQRIQEAMA